VHAVIFWLCFARSHGTCVVPNATSIEKREKAVIAQSTSRGDPETKPVESEEGDVAPDLFLKHSDATLVTNVRRQMKHLKHASETFAKTPEKHLKSLQKHTQHPYKTLANMCETYATCKLTYDKNTCNIYVKKQMKHCEQKPATYVYNHCNICNISLYFCNTHKKHLQHTSKTLSRRLQHVFSSAT
jgi:hypothetical protein